MVFYVDWIYVPGVSSSGTFTITWGLAAGNATDYELDEDTNANFTSPVQLYQGPNQTFTVTGRPDGTYYYRVRGINTTYNTTGTYLICDHPHVVDSTLASVPPAPQAPGSVTVPTNSSSGLIPVSWPAVSGVNGYDLWASQQDIRSLAPPYWGPFGSIAAGLTQTSYTHTGIDWNEYRFRVRTFIPVASYTLYSPWSVNSGNCLVRIFTPSPPAFLNVPATSTTGSYTLTWGTGAGSASYELEEDISGTFSNPTLIYQGTALSFNVTGQPNGTYYYRVRGVNALFQGPWVPGSNPCTVGIQQVGTPAFITVPMTSTTGNYAIIWGVATNAASYELEEDTSGTFSNPTQVYQGTATSFNVTGKANGVYYYRVRGVNAGNQGPYAVGANPCTVNLMGTLTLAAGTVNPSGTEIAGATGVPVLQIDLSADAVENIILSSFTVTDPGTLDLTTGIVLASLSRDVNGDGQLDAGDVWLANARSTTSSSVTFTGLSETVPANGSTTWLVTYDLSTTAPLGATFQGTIAQNTDVSATGSISANPAITGAPVTGGLKTIGQVGSLAITPCAGNATGGTAIPGTDNLPLLQFKLVAGSVEAVTVTALACTGSGTGNESTEVDGVFLYQDANGNDGFDPGIDTFIGGPLVFFADDGNVTFPLNLTLLGGSQVSLFVVYKLSDSAVAGSTFRAGLATNGDVAGTGVMSGQAVTVSGAPIWGGEYTVTAPPPPPPADSDGSCGGGVGVDPGSLWCWALLCAGFILAWRSARRGDRIARH
jgi:hypothetical protein